LARKIKKGPGGIGKGEESILRTNGRGIALFWGNGKEKKRSG